MGSTYFKYKKTARKGKKEKGEIILSKTVRKKRDGTGSYKDSYQRQKSKIGRRKQAGLPCPKKGK